MGSASNGMINVKSYGAIGDGVADDTAAIQAAVNQALNTNAVCYIPAGDYLISSKIDFVTQSGWAVQGSGSKITRIVQDTDNIPIFDIGTTSGDLNAFTISGIGFDYSNFQTSSNIGANCILWSNMPYEFRMNDIYFISGYYGFKVAAGVEPPWGDTLDDIRTHGGFINTGLSGGLMDWSEAALGGSPNHKWGRFLVYCTNSIGPIFNKIRAYNSSIDSIEFLDSDNNAVLIDADSQFAATIGGMKLESFNWTKDGTDALLKFPNGPSLSIGQIHISGSNAIVNPVSGYLEIIRAGASASNTGYVSIGGVHAEASSMVGDNFVVSVSDYLCPVDIGNIDLSGGWSLNNQGGSQTCNYLKIKSWVNDRLANNNGDADKELVRGDGNLQTFNTTFTSPRTITIPNDNNNMCAGLYYDLSFNGSINGANTATIVSGSKTLAVISSDKEHIRFTWRRNASFAYEGWVITDYGQLL